MLANLICYDFFYLCHAVIENSWEWLQLFPFSSLCPLGGYGLQARGHSSVPGQTALRGFLVQTSWHATTEHIRGRSASPAHYVTSVSWGVIIWPNTPAATQAFTPACFRAPQSEEAAPPPPSPPATLETRALLRCETHRHNQNTLQGGGSRLVTLYTQ